MLDMLLDAKTIPGSRDRVSRITLLIPLESSGVVAVESCCECLHVGVSPRLDRSTRLNGRAAFVFTVRVSGRALPRATRRLGITAGFGFGCGQDRVGSQHKGPERTDDCRDDADDDERRQEAEAERRRGTYARTSRDAVGLGVPPSPEVLDTPREHGRHRGPALRRPAKGAAERTENRIGGGGFGPVSDGLFAWLVGIGGLVLAATWIATQSVRSKRKKAEA